MYEAHEGRGVIFASPDFGAAGMVVILLVGVAAAVLGVSTLSFWRGVTLLKRRPPRRRWPGVALIGAAFLLPVACYTGPSVLFRLEYKTPPLREYPRGVVAVGMSAEEVKGRLGEPHEVHDRNPAQVYWMYWRDAIQFGYFIVYFGPDGLVDSAHGD